MPKLPDAARRECTRCKRGTETCIIHPNFWTCDRCDAKTTTIELDWQPDELKTKPLFKIINIDEDDWKDFFDDAD